MASVAGRSVQLNMWPDDRRGVPNAVLRSALFSAAKPSRSAPALKDRLLAVLGPYEISYTGPQLYQSDLDVWLECIHWCRRRELGNETEFQVRTFLKSLGRANGQPNRKWLVGTFQSLRATAVRVEWKDAQGNEFGYVGGLVDSLAYEKSTGRWSVRLDPRIASLFAPEQHTWLRAPARQALGRGYLAKWLHGYFSSHRRPYPLSVEKLQELSGSQGGHLRRFRQSLRKALDEVARVETAEGRTFAWAIDSDDRVHVIRDPKAISNGDGV